MIVDLKRTYLEMRPDLLRVYDTAYADGALAPMLHALGFALLRRSVRRWTSGRSRCRPAASTPGSPATSSSRRHLPRRRQPPTVSGTPVASLSAREREVLAALADGLTNQELAERLFISERTANRHLSNIFTKLGVRNRTAAARVAFEAGLAG